MTRIPVLLALLAALAFNGHAVAAEFDGVTLHLNGQGLHSKFFV